jgi:K+-transporting ATPase ATPase B chain
MFACSGIWKAQADTLRKSRKETTANTIKPYGTIETVPSTQLKIGDRCVITANEVIPGDGDVIEGIAVVDESAITGESAPVVREAGGDRSAVTGGTVQGAVENFSAFRTASTLAGATQ